MNAIITEWEAMTEAEQVKAIKTAVNLMTFVNLRSASRVNALYALAEMGDLVNETWVRLYDRLNDDYIEKLDAKRTSEGKKVVTLREIVNIAASSAVCTYRKELDHSKQLAGYITDEDGHELDPLDNATNSNWQVYAPAETRPTEKSVVHKISLEQFTAERDEIDRQIITYQINGYTQQETAAITLITQQAIQKRINKLRRALELT